MRKSFASLTMALVFGFAATATEPVNEGKKQVNAEKSKISWKAYKVGGGHEGTVALKEGSLTFVKGKLTAGEFIVDMPTLTATDMEGDGKSRLDGHLKSDDFFGTENHKTSKLVFTGVKPFNQSSYTVTGDLTIKGITKPVTFVVSVYTNKATATVKVDRSKYDIKYNSGSFFDNLGDKLIYDEFDLVVDLVY